MKSILTAVVIALVFVSSALYAGTAATVPLTIEWESGVPVEAFGNMWLVRSSENDVEALGCSFKGGTDDWNTDDKWGWCRARDAGGVSVRCWTYDENQLDALQAISPYSFVRFRFAGAEQNQFGVWEGTCTLIQISIQSLHIPNFANKGKK
jgi:hypothetical protein